MITTEQSSPMTGARQTMSTWSRHIETLEDLPPHFQESFGTLPDPGAIFPYTVFAPRMTHRLLRNPENVICDINETWHILKNTGGELEVSSYPLQRITDIELGHILLYSWITVNGQNMEGKSDSSSIEYNAASSRHYSHFFDQFKAEMVRRDDISLEIEQEKFDILASSTFKFMNYARNSIIPGEEVIHFVWQPEIQVPRFAFNLFPFTRTLTTAHLLILTSNQVILLREDERSNLNRGIRYGGVSHFIPLHNIRSSSLTEQQDNRLIFGLQLCDNRQKEWIFADSLRQELKEFQILLAQRLAS